MPEDIDISMIDIWVQDESRIGQQGSLTRIWVPLEVLDHARLSNNNLFLHISMGQHVLRQKIVLA